jgi:two-component system, OmpR family, sensor kinase
VLSTGTLALLGGDYYHLVWYRDGSLLARAANAPHGEEQPEQFERDTLVHWRTHGEFREAFHCSGFGDCVLAGRAISADLAAMRRFTWGVAAVGCAMLAMGLGVGGWIIARAIRPIGLIATSAERISQGNLAERIDVGGAGSELAQLAGVLNSTFARLEAAFLRERQFTADAAHELRTPLAVIISDAQSTLKYGRAPAEYRETIETCLDAAQQMRRLTDSLLDLARLDAGEERGPRVSVDIVEIARACAERVRPLAERRGIRVHCDLKPATAHSTAERVSQVITNLVTNAVQYNKDDGEVRIVTRAEEGHTMLLVADTGIGIAGPDLERIFDRFFCVDPSRSRAAGHNGLGLAITKAIVERDGGTIQVESAPGLGTTFEVRVPSGSR